MAYTTAQALLEQFGAKELAEVAGPRDRTALTPSVLRAHIAGDDITGETADVQAAAEEAKDRIENAIAEAEGIADAHIRSAGYTTPLATAPAYLAGAVEDIARYLLHKDRPSDAVVERNKQARALLGRIAAGSIVIVEADGDLPARASGADIKVAGPDETYTAETLSSFVGRL